MANFMVGEVLNGVFEVERILSGGMGIVYVCKILAAGVFGTGGKKTSGLGRNRDQGLR